MPMWAWMLIVPYGVETQQEHRPNTVVRLGLVDVFVQTCHTQGCRVFPITGGTGQTTVYNNCMSKHTPTTVSLPQGRLYVLSAPSGAGKSSLVKALLEKRDDIVVTTSHTTRAPRGQEQHGTEYFFVSSDEFDELVAEDAFLEWAQVHEHRYGTSRAVVQNLLSQGLDVILEIDYQGAFQVQRRFPDAVLIFILPPSLEELRRRIEKRGEDAPDKIDLRMRNALQEMHQCRKYNFVIINSVFTQALQDLESAIRANQLTFPQQRLRQQAVFAALGLRS